MSSGLISTLKGFQPGLWGRKRNKTSSESSSSSSLTTEDSSSAAAASKGKQSGKSKGKTKFPKLPKMGNVMSSMLASRNHYVIQGEREYAERLLSRLNELRSQNVGCDVTIDGETIPAHKLLVSYSEDLLKVSVCYENPLVEDVVEEKSQDKDEPAVPELINEENDLKDDAHTEETPQTEDKVINDDAQQEEEKTPEEPETADTSVKEGVVNTSFEAEDPTETSVNANAGDPSSEVSESHDDGNEEKVSEESENTSSQQQEVKDPDITEEEEANEAASDDENKQKETENETEQQTQEKVSNSDEEQVAEQQEEQDEPSETSAADEARRVATENAVAEDTAAEEDIIAESVAEDENKEADNVSNADPTSQEVEENAENDIDPNKTKEVEESVTAACSEDEVKKEEDPSQEELSETPAAAEEEKKAVFNPKATLVDFLYTAKCKVDAEHVAALQEAAERFQFTELCEASKTFLENSTSAKDKDPEAGEVVKRCFTFEDKEHPVKMLQHLHKLKTERRDIDCVGKATKTDIEAHKLVLAASSDYFRAKVNFNRSSDPQQQLALAENSTVISDKCLDSLVSFLYQSEVDVSAQNNEELMRGAVLLRIPEVVEGCAEFLETTLSVSGCLHIRDVAMENDCRKLRESAEKFIFEHFREVAKSKRFNNLSLESLTQLLSSDLLNLDGPLSKGEVAVYTAVKKWLDFSPEERKQHIEKAFSVVRFPLIGTNYLVDEVSKDQHILSQDQVCQSLTSVIAGKSAGKHYGSAGEMRGFSSIMVLGGSSMIDDETSEMQGYSGVAFNKKVSICNPLQFRFHELTSLPDSRSLHCVVSCGPFVFVIGGFDTFSCITETVMCFDVAAGVWQDVPGMKLARACFSAHAVGKYVYVVGGLTPKGYTSKVERLNRETMEWKSVARLPHNIYRHAGCVSSDGKLVISGGESKSSEVFSMDPKDNEWEKMPSLQRGRHSHVMAAVGEKLYVFGGEGMPFSAECFENDRWTLIKCGDEFPLSCLFCPCISVLGGDIYLVGGWRAENDASDVISIYETSTSTWRTSPSVLPIAVGSGAACTVKLPESYWKLKFALPKLVPVNNR